MAKLDLTQQFYEIAKAAGPGDHTNIYKDQLESQLAISQQQQKTMELVMARVAQRKAILGKIRTNFETIGKETLQKLASTGAGGNDETLNNTLFDRSFDYFQKLADEYVSVSSYGSQDSKEDKKARMLIEAKAVKAINIITRLRADIVTMSGLAADGTYSANGTGAAALDVLTRIMNQGDYDDVEPIWSDDGLTLRVATERWGTVDVDANHLRETLENPAWNMQGGWINLAAKAETTGQIKESVWQQDNWNSEVLKALEQARMDGELKAFYSEPHHGSENAYKDDLTKNQQIALLSITPELFTEITADMIQANQDPNNGFNGFYKDANNDGFIDRKDFIDNPEIDRDSGELNMFMLMDALTDPGAPGYNEATSFAVASNYYTAQLKQNFDLGKEKLRIGEQAKIFEKEGKSVHAQGAGRDKSDVMDKIENINTYTAFYDWKGKKWMPTGEGDRWSSSEWSEPGYKGQYSEESTDFTISTEELLGGEFKIAEHLWGTMKQFTPGRNKFMVNPDAQAQVNKVVSNTSLGVDKKDMEDDNPNKLAFNLEKNLFNYEQKTVARKLKKEFGRPGKRTPGWDFKPTGSLGDYVTATLWGWNEQKTELVKIAEEEWKVDKTGQRKSAKAEAKFIKWMKKQTNELVPGEQIRNRAQE